MPPKKRYDSVVAMVHDSPGGKTLAAELATQIASRRIVKRLQIARCLLDLSQAELARRMKCSRSKIAKIEASKDADLRVGDLLRYAAAVDVDPSSLLMADLGNGRKTAGRRVASS
jgi:predicted transcriptional regulator